MVSAEIFGTASVGYNDMVVIVALPAALTAIRPLQYFQRLSFWLQFRKLVCPGMYIAQAQNSHKNVTCAIDASHRNLLSRKNVSLQNRQFNETALTVVCKVMQGNLATVNRRVCYVL